MNKWHLLWIIPLTILITILLWEAFIVMPESKLHWDITYSCLEELYNLTITRY